MTAPSEECTAPTVSAKDITVVRNGFSIRVPAWRIPSWSLSINQSIAERFVTELGRDLEDGTWTCNVDSCDRSHLSRLLSPHHRERTRGRREGRASGTEIACGTISNLPSFTISSVPADRAIGIDRVEEPGDHIAAFGWIAA